MSAARVRIGRVRLKAGGAELRIFDREQREDGENYKGLIVNHARRLAEMDGELIGFFVIGLFADGSYSSGCRQDKNAAIGRTMLPAYIGEIVRRDHITEPMVNGEI